MKTATLSQLGTGECARVDALRLTGGMRRRLLDIGFTHGVLVQRLYHAPSGDPAAYLVRGSVIALRSEEAARIEIAAR